MTTSTTASIHPQPGDRVPRPEDRLRVVRSVERESIWFLGDLIELIFTGADTEGRFTMAYHHAHAASEPPLHEHDGEDEMFYLLEGSVTFWAAEEEAKLGPGDSILLPHDLPHAFQVSPDAEARWLVFMSPTGFEEFYREVGDPAEYRGPRRGWATDEATERRLHESAERHGIRIIAPPGARPADLPRARHPRTDER